MNQPVLQDRYRLDRELGQGGMVRALVAEATARLLSLKRPRHRALRHFSDINRVAASAASSSRS